MIDEQKKKKVKLRISHLSNLCWIGKSVSSSLIIGSKQASLSDFPNWLHSLTSCIIVLFTLSLSSELLIVSAFCSSDCGFQFSNMFLKSEVMYLRNFSFSFTYCLNFFHFQFTSPFLLNSFFWLSFKALFQSLSQRNIFFFGFDWS